MLQVHPRTLVQGKSHRGNFSILDTVDQCQPEHYLSSTTPFWRQSLGTFPGVDSGLTTPFACCVTYTNVSSFLSLSLLNCKMMVTITLSSQSVQTVTQPGTQWGMISRSLTRAAVEWRHASILFWESGRNLQRHFQIELMYPFSKG